MSETLGTLAAWLLDGTAVLYLLTMIVRLAAAGKPRFSKLSRLLFLTALIAHTTGLLLCCFDASLAQRHGQCLGDGYLSGGRAL